MSASRCAAILCAALALPTAGANAQGLFESLFGFGSTQRTQPATRQNSPATPYREAVGRPALPAARDEAAPASRARYRTLCVRACDGYYFPISGAVTRSDFYRDARICQRSCGSDARLFYHASTSGDASRMVDLTGLPYARLPNAFRYRKQLVSGCKCRPEPWSSSELARHQGYAAEGERMADAAGEIGREPQLDDPEPTASDESQPDRSTPVSPAAALEPPTIETPMREIGATPPRPARDPSESRMRAPSPVAAARSTPQPRSRPAAAASSAPSLFGFAFGSSSPHQKKLRWPGD